MFSGIYLEHAHYRLQLTIYRSVGVSYTSLALLEGYLDTFDKGTY
jgi:hypothetical protein